MSHDFTAQKAETFATFADLSKANDLPDVADIDLFFVPARDDADWRALADALSREGYVCEWVDPREEEDETGAVSDEDPYLMATLLDQPVSASSIWTGEEHATRIALAQGFAPDGWGFEG